MSEGASVPSGGRKIVAAVWAAAGAVHLLLAFEGTAGPADAVSWVLAVAAVVGVVALFLRPRRETLLAAAVAGAIGVASFLVPVIGPLVGTGVGPGLDPWAFAGFVLDALTVRLAVFTLRRAARTRG